MEDLLSLAPTAAMLLALLYGAYWFLTRSSNPYAVIIIFFCIAIHITFKLSLSTSSVKPLAGKAKGAVAAGAAGSDKKFPIRVVYASQSGTSEGFARALKKEATHYNVNVMVEDISEFQADELRTESAPIFFLVATYGEGDPTDSAVEFQTWLMDKEREFEPLSQLKFGVFALGNRQYDKFAAFGKRVDARLEALQAQRLVCVFFDAYD
jgi:NADPH-ferrihemoprotein reductase